MIVSRINAVYYNDPEDGYVYAILSNDIDANVFVKELNDGIERYNKDIEDFEKKTFRINT